MSKNLSKQFKLSQTDLNKKKNKFKIKQKQTNQHKTNQHT